MPPKTSLAKRVADLDKEIKLAGAQAAYQTRGSVTREEMQQLLRDHAPLTADLGKPKPEILLSFWQTILLGLQAKMERIAHADDDMLGFTPTDLKNLAIAAGVAQDKVTQLSQPEEAKTRPVAAALVGDTGILLVLMEKMAEARLLLAPEPTPSGNDPADLE